MDTEQTAQQENFARLLQSNKERKQEERERKAGKLAYVAFVNKCNKNMESRGLPTGEQNINLATAL